MDETTTRERVLLALSSAGDADAGEREAPRRRSVVGLVDALEMGAETMADRVALLSTLSALEEEGLVTERTAPVAGLDAERTVYALTEAGRERASAIRNRLQSTPIRVRNGHEETVPVGAVDRFLPAPSLVRALARLTDDGVLYLDDAVTGGFVDRTTELDALADVLAGVREGEGRAVLVGGEPGVGKTTLVEEFLDRVGGDALVLRGGARGSAAEPYHAVREAVADRLPGSPFDREGVDPTDAGTLADARTSLFADVADGLLAVARDRPVVVFLDDLHLAAEPTLDLVEFLAGRLPEGPVMLVGTYRPDEPADGELAALVEAVEDSPVHDRIELSRFDRPDTRELVEWLVGTRRVPDSFVDLVHGHTGGNPLFVTESVTRLLERGVLDPDRDRYPGDLEAVGLPDEVERAARSRLAALDDATRGIVRTAAVVGDSFEYDVLARAVDIPETDLREYLDVLVDAGLFERLDEGRLRFASGLVRETAAERVPDDRRADCHARVAAALEAVAGDDPERASAVAAHLEAAGEDERALSAWLDAAAHAESVYAQELALEAYERALDLARDRGDDRVLSILESMGEIRGLLGDRSEATRTLEYVLNEADYGPRRRRVARKLAEHHRRWDEYDRAVEAADRGLGVDGDDRTPETCRLLLAKADALANRGDMPEARELYDRALSVARDLDEPRLRADALRGRASIVWRQTPAAIDDDTVATMERAIDLLEEAGDDAALADALEDMGVVYSYYGDLDRGTEFTERALERKRETGDRKGALGARYDRAYQYLCEIDTGRVDPDEAMAFVEETDDEARALADEGIRARLEWVEGLVLLNGHYRGDAALAALESSLDTARRLDLARWKLYNAKHLAHLELYVRDDPEKAREYATEAVEVGRGAERFRDAAIGLVHLAAACREDGDPAAGLDHLEEALALAVEDDAVLQELSVRVELVRTHLALGDVAAASEAGRAVERLVGEYDTGHAGDLIAPIEGGQLRPLLAAWGVRPRLDRAEGDLDRAVRGFEVAREAAREARARFFEVEFAYELGTTLAAAGDLDRARSVLAAARDDADAIDWRLYRRKCERALDELDADGPTP